MKIMAKSQKVTVTENSSGVVTATAANATPVDVLTTAISTDSAVTGMLGLAQRAAFFVGGMAVQSKLKTNTFNFLK